MREGMVLYDARGREIWACPNVDSRATEEAAELVRSGAAQEIYERAGDWVAITAPARFLWIARHQPEIFATIAHVGMLGDWILTKLSGDFVTDPSLGSSSGMFDLAARDWSDRVLELCGLDRVGVPASCRVRHRRRERDRGGGRRDRAPTGNARSSPAAPTRSWPCSASASPSPAVSRSSAAASGSTPSSSTSR